MPDNKTILVVDDDHELTDGLRMVLERNGYRVLVARDGNQGKQVIYQQRPDLVILDMMLPRRSGFLALEKIKGREDSPLVIMVTANEGKRHQEYARSLGVDDYLLKPVPLHRLIAVAADLIAKQDQEDDAADEEAERKSKGKK